MAKGILAEYGQGEVAVIEQDSYYKDLSHKLPKERAQHNFDHPDAIDIDLFQDHLKKFWKQSCQQIQPKQLLLHHVVLRLAGVH